MRHWDRSHHGTYQLHGHAHGTLESIGKQLDVGVDCHNYTPISIERIFEIMKTKPDNPEIDHHRRKNEG